MAIVAAATATRWRQRQRQLRHERTGASSSSNYCDAMAHSYQPHSIRSDHGSLRHTAGRVLELSRAFGTRALTMAQGRFDLPFPLGVREIMDHMLSGSCWTPPVRLSHFSSAKDTNHLTTATCSPSCPSLVVSLFPQTARLEITANSLINVSRDWKLGLTSFVGYVLSRDLP